MKNALHTIGIVLSIIAISYVWHLIGSMPLLM